MSLDAVPARVEATLNDHFGQQPARASVSFLGVEPIEVLRYEAVPGEFAYVSLGMSRRPMTAAAESVIEMHGPRAELMISARGPITEHGAAWRALAVLAAAPVVEGVVYSVDMTVDLGEPLTPSSHCTGGVVAASEIPATPVDAAAAGTDEVAVLRVLPATSAELAWARVHGTPALRDLWTEQGCDLLDLYRQRVVLPDLA